MLLEEVDLWGFVDTKVVKLIYVVQLDNHTNKMAKLKKIIIDYVKDHLIPDVTKKNMTKYMYDAVGHFVWECECLP